LIAAVGSLILIKAVDLIIGVRVAEEDEITGLDLSVLTCF
jgi:ammonia channel protein AmtB